MQGVKEGYTRQAPPPLISSETAMSSSSVASGDAEAVASPATPAKSSERSSQSSSPALQSHSPVVEPQNPFDAPSLASSGSTAGEGGVLQRSTPERAVEQHRPQRQPLPINPDLQTLAISPAASTSPDHSSQMNPTAAGSIPSSPAAASTTLRNPQVSLSLPNLPGNTQGVIQHQTYIDDDENTAPSSAALSSEQHSQDGALARFIYNTRRRMSSVTRDTEEQDVTDGALIAGYLQKLGRNGKWQTRWFETDGECLSYYKSAKRSKLLATLDLEKVGNIEVDMDDPMGCSFRIQVLGRLYHLRADSRGICRDWVITLNRVKEARMQQGNVKLNRDFMQDQPRVVVVSNRERTRAVDGDQNWDQLIMKEDPTDPAYISQRRRSALESAVVARWSKRHSTIQRLGTKLSKWARSLKKYSCAEIEREKIFLDRHVHPPGHDDKTKTKGLSDWIDKEASGAAAISVDHPPKPTQLEDRSPSTASDYDARMIS